MCPLYFHTSLHQECRDQQESSGKVDVSVSHHLVLIHHVGRNYLWALQAQSCSLQIWDLISALVLEHELGSHPNSAEI